MSKLPPMFSYYGGKHRSSGRYPEPLHGTIIEPFAGSAGYSHRYHELNVILIEKDPTVAAVWRYLISASADDIIGLPLVPLGEDVRDHIEDPAAQAFVGFKMRSACASPARSASRGFCTYEKQKRQMWTAEGRERVAEHVEKINHWQVIEGSYVDAPDVEATWFVDPPYNNKAGSHYRHGPSGIEYAALASWCRQRSGQVIVCENAGADWLPFRTLYPCNGVRRRSTEAIWLSGGDA